MTTRERPFGDWGFQSLHEALCELGIDFFTEAGKNYYFHPANPAAIITCLDPTRESALPGRFIDQQIYSNLRSVTGVTRREFLHALQGKKVKKKLQYIATDVLPESEGF